EPSVGLDGKQSERPDVPEVPDFEDKAEEAEQKVEDKTILNDGPDNQEDAEELKTLMKAA
ncbi:unnamed protein product, partial [Effrenium voratum]